MRPWVPQRRALRRGPWLIIAEERVELGGGVRWDVYGQHDERVNDEDAFLRRVPAGPNLHHEPAAEMARLDALIAWPS